MSELMPSAFVGPPAPSLPVHLQRQAEEEDRRRNVGIGWKVGPALAAGFDAWTTQDALKRGGEEANPVLEGIAGNPAALYGIEIGSGILAGLVAHKLARAGHPNMARLVSAINIGGHTAAGVHNLSGGR